MSSSKLDELVDIRDALAGVEAENRENPEERIRSFLEKIGNPYEYRVGSVIVRVSFSEGMTMDDCFSSFLAAM